MNARARSASVRSSATVPLYYTYLKPGALAQLRYSKSKKFGSQTLYALAQLDSNSDATLSQPHAADLAMNGIPCFNIRVTKYPRCLQRKKLVAVTPFFSQT